MIFLFILFEAARKKRKQTLTRILKQIRVFVRGLFFLMILLFLSISLSIYFFFAIKQQQNLHAASSCSRDSASFCSFVKIPFCWDFTRSTCCLTLSGCSPGATPVTVYSLTHIWRSSLHVTNTYNLISATYYKYIQYDLRHKYMKTSSKPMKTDKLEYIQSIISKL